MQCAEHVLHWAGQRGGEETAVDAEGAMCVLISSFLFSFSFCLQVFRLISITHTSTLLAEPNKTDPTHYVLTLEQMIENDYPTPSSDVFENCEGFVAII
jgi:hypothetical protein